MEINVAYRDYAIQPGQAADADGDGDGDSRSECRLFWPELA